MKRGGIHSYVFLIMVFFIAATFSLCNGKSWAKSAEAIRIGVVMDMTGPAAVMGIPFTNGFKNYFRHLNDMGGINGQKVKLTIEDDRYSIPMAVAAFKKLVFRDKVLAILGMGGTGQTTALFPHIEKHKIVIIPLSWSWTMTDPIRKFIFTPGNDNKDEINIIMEYIVNTLKAKDPRIAVISPDVEFGKSGVRVAKAKAQELNVALVGQEIMGVGAIDGSSQMLSLKRKKATHVIILETNGATVAAVRAAKRIGYFPKYFGSFHAFGDEVAKIAGDAAKEVHGAAAFGSWYDSSDGITELKKITLGIHPEITPPNRYYVKAWIISKIMREGLIRAGEELNGDSIANALETIQNLDMSGLTGPISYSPTKHKGNDYARLYKADVEKGYFVPITDWVTATH